MVCLEEYIYAFFSSFCCAKFIILVYMKKRGQGGGCKLQFQSHSIFHSLSIVCFIFFSLCKSSFFSLYFCAYAPGRCIFVITVVICVVNVEGEIVVASVYFLIVEGEIVLASAFLLLLLLIAYLWISCDLMQTNK